MSRAYTSIEVTHVSARATVTLNNPARKNALSQQMVNELIYALDDAFADKTVRVILMTGAGGTFCAGGDLKQMGNNDALPHKGDYVDLLQRLRDSPKPVVARVEGAAMGGGLGLVASCHFAVASETAKLGTPEIKLGLFPMMIMAVLSSLVPRRELMNMMLLGDSMTGDKAKELGLVSHVVSPDVLDAEVARLVARLETQSPTAMRMGLAAFARQQDLKFAEALPFLREQLMLLLGTPDAQEGLSAFFEKRTAKWVG